jgi:hypothetical protein
MQKRRAREVTGLLLNPGRGGIVGSGDLGRAIRAELPALTPEEAVELVGDAPDAVAPRVSDATDVGRPATAPGPHRSATRHAYRG